ncbi:hypothetical protein ACIGCK_05475 [Microbacterium sp. NPDC078428]|uniref:hypothetical protein n=1 Tax=Microbacterium sp. NPDC078428 TaxID=3364190 RepID=UPI0037C76E3C
MPAPTRSRPIAVDGHSFEAAAAQTEERITAVQAHIIAVLQDGPRTDDAIRVAYEQRVQRHGAPPASPSSLRTRRADLCRRGIVAATSLRGESAYHRPATVWALTSAAREAAPLW